MKYPNYQNLSNQIQNLNELVLCLMSILLHLLLIISCYECNSNGSEITAFFSVFILKRTVFFAWYEMIWNASRDFFFSTSFKNLRDLCWRQSFAFVTIQKSTEFHHFLPEKRKISLALRTQLSKILVKQRICQNWKTIYVVKAINLHTQIKENHQRNLHLQRRNARKDSFTFLFGFSFFLVVVSSQLSLN